MPPTTRFSARQTSGAPNLPPPTPYWQVPQPPPRAASLILGDPMNSAAASFSQPAAMATRASTRKASAACQLVAADDSSRQDQASAAPGSPILGGTMGFDTPLAPASQPVITSDLGNSFRVLAAEQPYVFHSSPPPAVSLSQPQTMVANNSLGFAKSSSSSQPVTTSTHPDRQLGNRSQALAAKRLITVPTSSRANQVFTAPATRTVIDSANTIFSLISSSQPVGSPARKVLRETMRQGNAPPSSLEHIALTTSDTFHKDLNDPYTRNLVGLLQQNNPWAPAKLCHSMLVGCRYYEDANTALRKLAIDMPDSEDQINRRSIGKVLGQLSFSGSFDSSKLPTVTSSFSGQTPNTAPSSKNGRKPPTDATIEHGQQLLSFSKPAKSPPAIFSKAERQRVIAASTENAADRVRASFVANAVLYKAFSTQDYSYGRVTKNYSARHGTTNFSMTSGAFPQPLEKYALSKKAYRGTDRGKYQPLSFNHPEEGRVVLQSINLAFPYVKVSVEELRLGDYIRGRKKAPHLFDLFKKLPAEIRCMIWRFAMTPRTIELRYDYSLTKCWTLAKVPAMLHVTHEARYEALKRYTLAFGIKQTPDKTYFDFKRDTLFLTYEKWHEDGEYEDEIDRLSWHFVQSEEAKKIESLAIDQDLVDILAQRLEDEEEEWYDMDDDEMPEPELEVLPYYESLQSLTIVKTQIDGFWDHENVCGCDEGDDSCDLRKRMEQNDKALFVPTHASAVANKTKQEFYKQLVEKVKIQNPDWSKPELSYTFKRATKQCGCGRFH